MLLSYESDTGSAPAYSTKWSFFVKYYSIAFSILPGVAGGLALELLGRFPWANRGTILKILQQEKLTQQPQKKKVTVKPIPVGHHRIQMDIQQLPAVKGDKGFEYKISAIHLRTRLKYSEIHPDRKSKTVAGVLQRALDLLPPFS